MRGRAQLIIKEIYIVKESEKKYTEKNIQSVRYKRLDYEKM